MRRILLVVLAALTVVPLRRTAGAQSAVVSPARGASVSQAAVRSQLSAKFRERLVEIARTTDGVVGIQVIDLRTGERFGVNDTLTFPQGSAIKIPILIELFRQVSAGTLSLDERLAVRSADQVGGTGIINWFGDGLSLISLRDLAVLMIVLSDNTATNLLIDRVGMPAVNGTMVSLGLPSIKLQRKMIQVRESAAGRENIATPAQAAELMRRIHACDLPMTRSHCGDLRRILEIPKSGAFPASVPAGVRVAWKPGAVEGVETSWGLFALPGNAYVVTAMVTYSDGAPAERALRAVADASYEYFRRLARSTPFGVRVPLPLADTTVTRVPPP